MLRHFLSLIPYAQKDTDVVRTPDPAIVRPVRALLPDLTG